MTFRDLVAKLKQTAGSAVLSADDVKTLVAGIDRGPRVKVGFFSGFGDGRVVLVDRRLFAGVTQRGGQLFGVNPDATEVLLAEADVGGWSVYSDRLGVRYDRYVITEDRS